MNSELTDVSLNELEFRAYLLQTIITEYEGDTRLPTPMWSLAVINQEIGERMMAEDYSKLPDDELERRRQTLWEQIENARALFLTYGKILDGRRQAGTQVKSEEVLLAEIKQLKAQLAEVQGNKPPDQVVNLKTIVMKAKAKLGG